LQHGPLSPGKRAAAWQSVLWRERSVGQQAAEIMVAGPGQPAEADAAFQAMLPNLYFPSAAPSAQAPAPPSLSMIHPLTLARP
jgi:hypothetical protein